MPLTREDLLGRASCFCDIISVYASIMLVIRTHFIRVFMFAIRAKLCYPTHSAYIEPLRTDEVTAVELDPLLWRPPCLATSDFVTDLGIQCSVLPLCVSELCFRSCSDVIMFVGGWPGIAEYECSMCLCRDEESKRVSKRSSVRERKKSERGEE